MFALDHISSLPFGDPNAGKKLGDPVYSQNIALDVDFGLFDGMALNFSVPYVTSKYPGPGLHRRARRTLALTNRQDDGTYHGAVQDFRFGFRYTTIFIRGTDGGEAVRLGQGRPLALSPDRRWAVAVLSLIHI